MGERPLSEEEYKAAEGFTGEDEQESGDFDIEKELATLELQAEMATKKDLDTEIAARETDQAIASQVEADADAIRDNNRIELAQDAELDDLEKEYATLISSLQSLSQKRKNLVPGLRDLADEIKAEHTTVQSGNDKGEFVRFYIWANAKIKEYLRKLEK